MVEIFTMQQELHIKWEKP